MAQGEQGLYMEDTASGRTDRGELREVLLAFMDKYRGHNAGPGKTRLHKFVFFGDLYSLHWYGGRLTDASFKAYDFGAFSEDIQELLETLVNSGEVRTTRSPTGRGEQYHNTRKPKLSREKQEIIDEVWEKVKGLSDPELEQFSKETWLYEETPYDSEMDWEEYKEIAGTSTQWREVVRSMKEKSPVEDPEDDLEELIN